MIAVLQRVIEASVRVAGEIVGSIEEGCLVYLGVAQGDAEADAIYIAGKVVDLRIFPDEAGKMNLSLRERCESG
ncbi:MAG: D-aminoacyl-tRNA deacylase, partial [Spirochaetales bacterium]